MFKKNPYRKELNEAQARFDNAMTEYIEAKLFARNPITVEYREQLLGDAYDKLLEMKEKVLATDWGAV